MRALLSEFRMTPREWPKLVPLVESSINHTITLHLGNRAPVTVFTGLAASGPLDAVYVPSNKITKSGILSKRLHPTKIREITDKLNRSLVKLHKEVTQSKQTSREKSSKSELSLPNFEKGEFVLVAKVVGKLRDKLTALWQGPMRIKECLTPWVYEVENLVTHNVRKVHIQRMKFYAESSFAPNQEVLLQITHDSGTYEVEQITQHRFHNNRWELLVSWLGFEEEETSWEPLMQLYQDIPTLIKQYLKESSDLHAVDLMTKVIKKKYKSFT